MGYSEIINNLDKFVTNAVKNNIACKNCEYLFTRFLFTDAPVVEIGLTGSRQAAVNKQAAYWIIEDIGNNAGNLYKNKNVEIEFRLNSGEKIDVMIDGNSKFGVEYKWYGGDNTVAQSTFLSQFVKRDLTFFDGASSFQWRIKGSKLTKDKVFEYLSSPEGKDALNSLKIVNESKFLKLFGNSAIDFKKGNNVFDIEIIQTFLNTNYSLIFK